jgi:phosphoribosylaminoimidazole-succinocarboxamide synthase
MQARNYAAVRGIIIADTKFEFGLDQQGGVVLADKVLTPGQSATCTCVPPPLPYIPLSAIVDSSRFRLASKYEVGRSQ